MHTPHDGAGLKDLRELKGSVYAAELADVRKRCQEELDALAPDEPRLRGGVHIIHRDSSILHLKCAFSRAEGDWVYVFTANHGVLTYLKDELVACHDDGEPADASAAKLRHAPGDARPPAGGGIPAGADTSSTGFGDMPISTGNLV